MHRTSGECPLWMLTFLAIAIAMILGSFTDWLFMDVLARRFYAASPALWPPRGGTARILVPQVTGTAATLSVSLQKLQWMRLAPGRGELGRQVAG